MVLPSSSRNDSTVRSTGLFITSTGEAPGTNRLEIVGTLDEVVANKHPFICNFFMGERGRRANPAYTTSKAALSAYLEALRNRCSRYGVNVVTVKPGFVDTAMTKGMKGLLWLIPADEAARQALALARRGSGASAFVPARWALVAWVVRTIPSWLFRRTNV